MKLCYSTHWNSSKVYIRNSLESQAPRHLAALGVAQVGGSAGPRRDQLQEGHTLRPLPSLGDTRSLGVVPSFAGLCYRRHSPTRRRQQPRVLVCDCSGLLPPRVGGAAQVWVSETNWHTESRELIDSPSPRVCSNSSTANTLINSQED